jgi:hypothetical protein
MASVRIELEHRSHRHFSSGRLDGDKSRGAQATTALSDLSKAFAQLAAQAGLSAANKVTR